MSTTSLAATALLVRHDFPTTCFTSFGRHRDQTCPNKEGQLLLKGSVSMLIAAYVSYSINAAINPPSFARLRPVNWGTHFLSTAGRPEVHACIYLWET